MEDFKADIGDIVYHLGVKSKIIGIGWCSYTKQFLYDIKELEPPFYQVRAVGSKWRALTHFNKF